MRTKEKHSPVWVDSQPLLREWYSSALGQSIIVQLEQHLGTILPAVFGYQGLQLGSLGTPTSFLEKAGIHRPLLLDSPLAQLDMQDNALLGSAVDDEQIPVSPVEHNNTLSGVADRPDRNLDSDHDEAAARVKVATGGSGDFDNSARPAPDELQAPHLYADVLNLPIANDVMKIVLLPHTLDFCNDPYQVLREVDRVLTADGHIVIVGFSPWSQFGLRRNLIRWHRSVPWNGSYYSRNRVSDWLSVLNYRVHESQAFYLRPPLQSSKILERTKILEKNQRWLGLLGGLYLLHVRKQTLPMTPAKRAWLPQRQRIQVGSLVRAREQGVGRTTAARRKQSDKPDS